MAGELTVDEQASELARRYSLRAAAYDRLWSPAIQPLGERLLAHLPLAAAEHVIDVATGAGSLLPAIQRLAPRAEVLGIDRAEGMLKLARQRHHGPLAIMDAQQLDLPADRFDVAVVAFVLFHLPDPQRCLDEVCRVLRQGGMIGTTTWGAERYPAVNAVWNEELTAAGAPSFMLPATDNRACCDSEEKITRLLQSAGFHQITSWTESLEHRWRPEDHFEYQVRSRWRLRLESLDADARDACLERVRARIESAGEGEYIFSGDVVMSTATK